MNTLTAKEAYKGILDLIDWFSNEHMTTQLPMEGIIRNVAFTELIKLYSLIHDRSKKFYLPGEYSKNHMVIEYRPAPGCIILLYSEPSALLTANINLTKTN